MTGTYNICEIVIALLYVGETHCYWYVLLLLLGSSVFLFWKTRFSAY